MTLWSKPSPASCPSRTPPDFENPADGDPDDADNLPYNVYEITVRARDGSSTDQDTNFSDPLTVTVTVNGVNEDPVATDDAATTDEDTAVVISVLGNDTDMDPRTTLSGTTAPP